MVSGEGKEREMNSIEDRPDYAGSMDPNKTFAPAKPYDFNNPADQLRGGLLGPTSENQGLIDQFIQQRRQTVPPMAPPIKVFTVCVNSEMGGERYMAFLGSDPSKRATAGSREMATAMLLEAEKLIVVVEND